MRTETRTPTLNRDAIVESPGSASSNDQSFKVKERRSKTVFRKMSGLLCMFVAFASSAAVAGVQLPDLVLTGEICIHGVPQGAGSDVTVIAHRGSVTGPIVGTYRMGTRLPLGNRYALRVRMESGADNQPRSDNAARPGDMIVVTVRQGTGPEQGSLTHSAAQFGQVVQFPIVIGTGECTAVPGDTNCDGRVNNFDINAFILALSDPAEYAVQYPNCSILSADANRDGRVNNFDIDAFVQCIENQGCP